MRLTNIGTLLFAAAALPVHVVMHGVPDRDHVADRRNTQVLVDSTTPFLGCLSPLRRLEEPALRGFPCLLIGENHGSVRRLEVIGDSKPATTVAPCDRPIPCDPERATTARLLVANMAAVEGHRPVGSLPNLQASPLVLAGKVVPFDDPFLANTTLTPRIAGRSSSWGVSVDTRGWGPTQS